MAGGDRVSFAIGAEARSKALVTSQAAERVYRSTGPTTETHITLNVAPDATLSGCRKRRSSTPKPASRAGSKPRWHHRHAFSFRKSWSWAAAPWAKRWDRASSGYMAHHPRWPPRLRRSDPPRRRYRNADRTRVSKPMDGMWSRHSSQHFPMQKIGSSPFAKPSNPHTSVDCGASSWNGLLAVRMIGSRLETVRRALADGIAALRLAPMPRVWNT